MNVYFMNPNLLGHASYLTPGKLYKLETRQFKNMTGTIIDDEGDVIRITIDGYISPEHMEGCYHLWYNTAWIFKDGCK